MNAHDLLKTPNYHDILLAMLHDPSKHDELYLLLRELLRVASKQTREGFPGGIQRFFHTRCTLALRARNMEIEQKYAEVALIYDGIDRIIVTTINTSAFRLYTRRAFFAFSEPSESVAESARVLGTSRQAVYRAVEEIEAKLEKLPEVHGKPDDGVIAAKLWCSTLERIGYPVDELWKSRRVHVSPEENDRRVLEAYRIFETYELARMRQMSPDAKALAEGKIITKMHTLQGQLDALRGVSEAMAAE